MERRFILDAVNHGTVLLEWPERLLEQVREVIELEEDLAEVTRPFTQFNTGEIEEEDEDETEPKALIVYTHEEVAAACEALAEVIREEYTNLDAVADSLDEVLEDLDGLPMDEFFEPRLAEGA
ncbi:hypothetical protein [Actomonas aquatica]|uniref:Uncharacterized protein n=1 Tax=Actomonas aquatica TaxID=2866162 RepID=A0ABZ1C3I8_9BACT|nr:hypothetical protein [Opitutus sp. WL0086]WRQ85922.1 hypothetical protein K1X11_014000 [Opitutus sp. WL0086]